MYPFSYPAPVVTDEPQFLSRCYHCRAWARYQQGRRRLAFAVLSSPSEADHA